MARSLKICRLISSKRLSNGLDNKNGEAEINMNGQLLTAICYELSIYCALRKTFSRARALRSYIARIINKRDRMN